MINFNLTLLFHILMFSPFIACASNITIESEVCIEKYSGTPFLKSTAERAIDFFSRTKINTDIKSELSRHDRSLGYLLYIEVNPEIGHAAYILETPKYDDMCEVKYRSEFGDSLTELMTCSASVIHSKIKTIPVRPDRLSSSSGLVILNYMDGRSVKSACKQESYAPISFLKNSAWKDRLKEF